MALSEEQKVALAAMKSDAYTGDTVKLDKEKLKEDGQQLIQESKLDGSIYVDAAVEWKILNKLLRPENRNRINNISPRIFLGLRADTHAAMQSAFIKYGVITYEGIHEFMKGKVPGELTAATQGDLETLLNQGIRLATKRQLKRRGEWLMKLADQYQPQDTEIQDAFAFEAVSVENDSMLTLGAQSFLGDLHAKRSGEYIFARTGFKVTDRMMGGEWRPGGLIVMAGGAGTGKTTFYVNSAKKMAKGYVNKITSEVIQTASLFISLEMTQADLILKMVADELSIDNTDLASGEFEKILGDCEGQWETVEEIVDAVERKTAELQELPIYVIENGKITLAQMIYEIRKHVIKHNVRVVAIDYMQLINHHPNNNMNSDLGEVAIALKDLAKRLKITIILLSQINRSGEGLDAIRDSGEVQAVADVVVQLLKDDEDGFTNTGPLSSISLAWWKNRFGAAGRKTPIMFNGSYQRFEEVRSA